MPKECADLLEVVMLLEDFHGHAVPEVVRLQLRAADQPAVHLAEAPDVLARHRGPRLADAAPAPGGPEQWELRANVLDLLAEHPFNVRLQELHDRRGEGNISGLTALDPDAAQPPRPIEVVDAQRRHRLAPHPRVAQDQEDRHVTRSAAGLRRLDESIHDRRARNLLRRLAVVGCQRSPNNPHWWSLKTPHPPHEGGHRHDGDIVDGRDGGHRRHWPRGHTTRGGTHGSGGLLARGASAGPRGEAGGGPRPPATGTSTPKRGPQSSSATRGACTPRPT